MTLRLHDYLPSGNGYKVRLLLTQLGIPFERIEYDIDRVRRARPRSSKTSTRTGASPCSRPKKERFCQNPTRSCSTSLAAPRSSRTIVSEGRVRCSGCSSSSTAYFHRTPEFVFFALLTKEASSVRLTLNKVGESLELLN
jgi:hypothetical protein